MACRARHLEPRRQAPGIFASTLPDRNATAAAQHRRFRLAWPAFFLCVALGFAGIAFAITEMLDSSFLGFIGAVFVFLPCASLFSSALDTLGRERR